MSFNIENGTLARFWAKVDKRSSDECWLWLGGASVSKSDERHGKWNPYKSGLSCNTNRAVWELTYGEIPAGKRIKNTCGNYLCVNPRHLKISDDIEERFWSKVNKTPGLGIGDCWLWIARINQCGYGNFRANPKQPHKVAHRVAWELHYKQEIPEDKVIAHRCDVRNCVNPSHLFLATTKENMHDMIAKGRQNYNKLPPMIGSCNPSSKLNESKVMEIKRKLHEGYTHKQLSIEYGVSDTLIYNIEKGISWKHVK